MPSAKDNPPPGLTAKGERMYEHIKRSYMRRKRPPPLAVAKSWAAATVRARAAEGVPGLIANPERNPPGLDAAIESFEGFHAYDSKEVGQFPATMKIPEYVQLLGPCTYVTYRSDKWNDGSHDYIHEIDSYPRVVVGLVGGRQGTRRKVPQRIGNDATLIMVRTSAIGFGYTDGAGEQIDSTVRRCSWFWHPRGKALLLVREMRQLVAIIWGGKLGFEDSGIVG